METTLVIWFPVSPIVFGLLLGIFAVFILIWLWKQVAGLITGA